MAEEVIRNRSRTQVISSFHSFYYFYSFLLFSLQFSPFFYHFPSFPIISHYFSLFSLFDNRDGMPVAAKRISLTDLSFPYAFELNSDDLVFPYTKEAYLASEFRKDSIALTVILSPDGLLASTEGMRERIGFALSEPIQVAGTAGRTTANINVNGKIDTKLYSDSERKLLSEMDRQLDVITARSKEVVTAM